ncbi:PTS-dependent dihydroxyacetone kinase, dihydroxyacetone-binding subunit DhaK [Pontiella desulfatans]|uniref:PTS-dependent dihydroxyacetone kinase, dihydroxyacetone-binding subunit DhaK n=1 Tax=Pontiella desulfatans TaxID=2750659 RepID=A0A6C2U1I1_PONDE|nr:dihydroxyacetone kinase subunit DhaK [Pontiella desulfatans]VGO13747.1 PTS-dependent dihydroxyacetone kinase, dihydroxyacetone-binding subunit DhaK [Pontiella desulfatans]
MKKFINNPEELTKELLEGMCMAYPHKVKLEQEKLVCRATPKAADKVALVSLGGTGHEPAVQGFVGDGMLDVCAAGDIWAAPGPPTLLEALKTVKRDAGTLLITLNHAGDVMSAQMAKQMAEMEGIKVVEVITNEEIRPTEEEEGRGLGGCFFVSKIAGAAAERGDSLDDVVRIANKVNDQCATIAVLSELATHPSTGGVCGSLAEDEMEICAGQHGEGGGVVVKMASAKETAELLAEKIVAKLGLESGDEIALIVNGSGKTTLMELYVSFRDAKLFFEGKGIDVARGHAGDVLTVQEAGGYQLIALKLDDELKTLWDAPCDTPGYTVR